MQELERKLPRHGKCFALVSDDTLRRFNILEYPCDFEDINKQIDFAKAEYHFPTMISSESKVRDIFQYL